jgi:hypothetical protein
VQFLLAFIFLYDAHAYLLCVLMRRQVLSHACGTLASDTAYALTREGQGVAAEDC